MGVVTVTYNSDDVLDDFLDSLAKQTFDNFLLFAVDNASKRQDLGTACLLDGPADPDYCQLG